MTSSSLKIDDHEVGDGHPAFLIAEVAQAHDGSLGMAHAFIDLAKSCGADAIKFQTHIANSETTPLEEFRVNFSYEDATRFDYWKRMEFTAEQWYGLARHARESGLVFLSSAFSHEAVDLLASLDMPVWKIASGEITNQPLLKHIQKIGRPVLLSSGLSNFDELKKSVALLEQKKTPFGLFQCTSKYPTPFEDVGLNIIDDYREMFGCPVGLSDHSASVWSSVAAMSRGANMIEVHLAMSKFQFGPDTVASLLPEQFRQVAEARDAIHCMISNPLDKNAMYDEMVSMRRLFNKSIALRRDQRKGTVLSPDMLTAKKPGTGIPAIDIERYIGRALSRDVSATELLSEEDFES